jgi:hypothetical protein
MNKKRTMVMYVVLLLMLCILPLLSDLYSYNRKKVNVVSENIKFVSIKNIDVKQKIYIDGKISNLGVRFFAPSGQLYKDALIKISVRQNNTNLEELALARNLRVKSPYRIIDEINRIEENSREEMDYFFSKNLLGLKKGAAEVHIISDNLPEGTDLFCEVSDYPASGLPSAYAGLNYLGGPLVLQYDSFIFNTNFFYETFFLCILLCLIIFTAYIFSYKKELIQDKKLILPLLSFCFIVVIIAIKNPYASFMGEPRSEVAYEFWYKAHYFGRIKSVMTLMSGEALAWLERIFMIVADTVFPVKYVFVGAQLIELTWIAGVCSIPCLSTFRRFFSDHLRLAFSIFLGCFLFFDSQYFFWSCSYWACIFFFLFPFLQLNYMRKITFCGLLLLTIVLCVSRIYHVLLIPVAFMMAFRYKHEKRYAIYYLTVALFSSFEVIYSLSNAENLANRESFLKSLLNVGIFRMIENTFYYQIQVINSKVAQFARQNFSLFVMN